MKEIIYTIIFGFSLGMCACYFIDCINSNENVREKVVHAQPKSINKEIYTFIGNVRENINDESMNSLALPALSTEDDFQNHSQNI
ncbi:MAG: hypothetical protein V4544_00810 [Pseudomonadota bacterium]